MIIVSTDGSCLRNPGGAIGWAWVNHAGGSASGGAPTGTNQIAELRALLEAVRAHHGSEPLLIESDSLYAIKCASEWINGWRLNGWRTSTGGAVKNVELIRQIDEAISSRPGPVRFRWVRGHVGNYFNEQADTLAGQAARKVAAGALPDPDVPAPAAVEPAAAEPEAPAQTRAADATPPTTPIPVVPAHAATTAAAVADPAALQDTIPAPAPMRRRPTSTPDPDALTLF
ncbi:ribonuclease H [Nocardia sp. CC227C]|uniref:ribonuclease H family protein n=1 Tax=Nocardia sp. CC227C TaxID=3044562 RepID=UPI00278BBD62|nr:ribonuclease H [Nocardia sp. CC227C]